MYTTIQKQHQDILFNNIIFNLDRLHDLKDLLNGEYINSKEYKEYKNQDTFKDLDQYCDDQIDLIKTIIIDDIDGHYSDDFDRDVFNNEFERYIESKDEQLKNAFSFYACEIDGIVLEEIYGF